MGEYDALIAAAKQARENAHAPYSNFRVGAALRAKSGRIYTGCNVESASYGLTCCAERVAILKALSEGEHGFETIAPWSPTRIHPRLRAGPAGRCCGNSAAMCR